MAFGTNPTTVGQGALASNQFPISTVAVPNAAGGNLTALQGGPATSADTNGNVLAPVSSYVYDGNDVTQGSQADAAWSGSGSATQIALLKKIIADLAATLTVSGTITEANSTAILAALDDGQETMLNSLSVAIASDQSAVPTSSPTSTTGTPTSVAGSASSVALLASNTSRKGAYIYNDSSSTYYIGFFAHATLTTSNYTTQIPPGYLYELPTTPVYIGEISGIQGSASGFARITEMS